MQNQFCTTTNEFCRRNINNRAHARTHVNAHRYMPNTVQGSTPTYWISTVFDTFRSAAYLCNWLRVHDKTAFNSGVTVRGCGIPFWWEWSPPKRAGCRLTEHNYFNLYICILFDTFSDSNLREMHGTSNIVKFMAQYLSIVFKNFKSKPDTFWFSVQFANLRCKI